MKLYFLRLLDSRFRGLHWFKSDSLTTIMTHDYVPFHINDLEYYQLRSGLCSDEMPFSANHVSLTPFHCKRLWNGRKQVADDILFDRYWSDDLLTKYSIQELFVKNLLACENLPTEFVLECCKKSINYVPQLLNKPCVQEILFVEFMEKYLETIVDPFVMNNFMITLASNRFASLDLLERMMIKARLTEKAKQGMYGWYTCYHSISDSFLKKHIYYVSSDLREVDEDVDMETVLSSFDGMLHVKWFYLLKYNLISQEYYDTHAKYDLSFHKYCSGEYILSHPDTEWSMMELSGNKNLPPAFLEQNPKLEWDMDELSRNEAVTMEFVEKHLDWEWSIPELSFNPNLTLEFVEKHSNWDWYLNGMVTTFLGNTVTNRADILLAYSDLTLFDENFLTERYFLRKSKRND